MTEPVRVVIVRQRRRVDHGLHFWISVFTLGLWLPVWFIRWVWSW